MSESPTTPFLEYAKALHAKIINRISDPFKLTGKEVEEIRAALSNAYDDGYQDGASMNPRKS